MLLGAMLLREAIGTVDDTTQERAAAWLGVERVTLWRWLAGRNTPSLEQAVRIEAEFGVPVQAWVEAEGKKSGDS